MLTPDFTLANAFTFSRAALVPVIGVLVYMADGRQATGWAWAACIVFVLTALTDWADGWIARKTNTITELGALWDPIADKMLVIGVMAILATFGQLWWTLVIVVAIREIGMTIWRMRIIANGGGVVSARGWGKLKTATQLVGITGMLLPIVPLYMGQVVVLLSVIITMVSAVDLLWTHYRAPRTLPSS